MNYYTSTIPLPLAEKLKAKGMPMMTSVSISIVEDKPVIDENGEQWYRPSYAEVFDWLMSNRRTIIVIEPTFYEPYLGKVYSKDGFLKGFDGKTWHEAANAAIEKALTLI